MSTARDHWLLLCEGRTAHAWMNQDYTVFGLDPTPGIQPWQGDNELTLWDLGGGHVAFQIGNGVNAYASMRNDYGYQVQFQAPYSAGWITGVGGDEVFQIVPTGDGFFALFSPTFNCYVRINPTPNGKAGNCNALYGADNNITWAARFSAIGKWQASILDIVAVGQNATGMSFGGVDLSGKNIGGPNVDLTNCDFRGATGLAGASLAGANLQGALFGNLKLAGLGLSGANCTGADFTGTDFTGFTPGSPPPTMTGAMLADAVIPAGIPWTGAQLHDAVLAGANLTGADLSGPTTDLSSAHLGGAGVTVLTPDYRGSGIAGFILVAGDGVLAYDYNSTGHLDHLLCYMPGAGAIVIAERTGADNYQHVYFQGAPGPGIGGFTLSDPHDRIIAVDYTGNGHLDHLLCYRPGGGLAVVVAKGADGTFSAARTFTAGIGDFPLTDTRDRIVAYDWTGSGRLDHLLCYRPGAGFLTILQRQSDGTFSSVWSSTTGIGGWDLGAANDQVIAYDYEGNGNLDHVVVYRPGSGGIAILQHRSDGTFANVYWQGDPGNGIVDFPLSDPADRIIAYDFAGTGRLDHLFCYRPGAGLVRILARQPHTTTFVPVYIKPGGIGGYDFAHPADVAVAIDPTDTGTLGGLALCRPGPGTIWIVLPESPGPAALTGTRLDQTNLTGADLAGMDLRQPASLQGATLTGAKLAGATLAGVNLTGAGLAATDFTGCDLSSTTFSSPFVRSTDPNAPTIFARCTLPYPVIGLDWSCLDLTATTITGVPTDLTGLKANGMRRPNGEFSGLVLDGADFTSATLDLATFTKATLRADGGTKATFAGARLMGSDFTEAVLDQVLFTNATLGGVAQTQATKFSFAFVSNCDFTGASLYAVVFANATLVSGNVLTSTATMEEVDFSGAYLADADLSGANLAGATFDDAFLVQVVLNGTVLTPSQTGAKPASLTSACLQGADFTGVRLGGADLAGAVITNTRGQILVQHYDENGNLTPQAVMRYPDGAFPDVTTAFTDATTCPNGLTYKTNNALGNTVAQMMTIKSPPTSWVPSGNRPFDVHGTDPADAGRGGAGRSRARARRPRRRPSTRGGNPGTRVPRRSTGPARHARAEVCSPARGPTFAWLVSGASNQDRCRRVHRDPRCSPPCRGRGSRSAMRWGSWAMRSRSCCPCSSGSPSRPPSSSGDGAACSSPPLCCWPAPSRSWRHGPPPTRAPSRPDRRSRSPAPTSPACRQRYPRCPASPPTCSSSRRTARACTPASPPSTRTTSSRRGRLRSGCTAASRFACWSRQVRTCRGCGWPSMRQHRSRSTPCTCRVRGGRSTAATRSRPPSTIGSSPPSRRVSHTNPARSWWPATSTRPTVAATTGC